nr:MAG TPA: ASCH domain protein [Herelleviridae sp.]
MQKIYFNDHYGLTQAVIEGRKTMTLWFIPDEFFGLTWDTRGDTLVYENEYGDFIDVRHSKYTRYKVGEVVAVAQSYSTIATGHPDVDTFLLQVAKAHKIPLEIVQDLAGWNNKLFTKAELMPRRIRITGIKCKRLQDISDADCIKEGLEWDHKARMFYVSLGITNTLREWLGGTPREAFASLTDMISGSGTWESNLFVTAYEFELVK